MACFKTRRLVSLLFGLSILPGAVAGRAEGPAVTASLVADTTAVAPGVPFTVAVKLDVPPGYFTYYRTPGDFGVPTKVAFSAPAGFQVGPARFPGPEIKREDLLGKLVTTYTYPRSTMVLSEVRPPDTLESGDITISAQVSYQYCNTSGLCFPPKPAILKLPLPVASPRKAAQASSDARAIELVRRALPDPGRTAKYAKVHAALGQDRLRPGDRTTLNVMVEVQDGHKLQLNKPGENLIATELILDNAAGIEPSAPIFPESKAKYDADKGYQGRFVIQVPVSAKENLTGSSVRLSGLLRYQACTVEGACFPPRFASFELSVPVAAKGEKITSSSK